MSAKNIDQDKAEAREYARILLRSAIKSLFWVAFSERRRRQGYKLQDLADELGKDKSVVSRWFTGEPNWTIDTIADLATALNLTIEVEATEKSTGTVFAPHGVVEAQRQSADLSDFLFCQELTPFWAMNQKDVLAFSDRLTGVNLLCKALVHLGGKSLPDAEPAYNRKRQWGVEGRRTPEPTQAPPALQRNVFFALSSEEFLRAHVRDALLATDVGVRKSALEANNSRPTKGFGLDYAPAPPGRERLSGTVTEWRGSSMAGNKGASKTRAAGQSARHEWNW